MRNAKKLFINTLILTFVSVLLQTVGVFFNVYLTNRIGSAGIGVFSLIMSVYSLCVTLGCGGVRLASTRLTAENAENEDVKKQIIKKCMLYALITGTIMCVLLFTFSGLISRQWINDVRTERPLKILALCLPFVAMSSALNGYFTAERKIIKYSAVRVAEQFVRIAVTASILMKFLRSGLEYGCIAIVIGILFSEMFSFTLLFILDLFGSRGVEKGKCEGFMKKLLRIALPDAVGTGLRSVLLTVEHMLIPVGFRRSGSSAENAMSIYGNIHGKVFPVLLYPSAVFSSLSGLLVPEIAEYNSLHRSDKINNAVNRILKLTVLCSVYCAAAMYAFAGGLTAVIYKTDESVLYMEILAPLVPVMYCDMTVDGMLKGLDQQFHSMMYNIIDSSLCVVLVWLILPKYSVRGYISILYLSETLNFYLSLRRLTKVCEVRVSPFNDIVIPSVCAVCSNAAGAGLLKIMCPSGFGVVPVAVCISVSALVYITSLLMFGCLTKEDVSRMRATVFAS